MTQQESGLSAAEIDIFARGLYYLANVDGIDPRETDLIAEFLKEAGAPLAIDDLKRTSFDPGEAAEVLQTTTMRHIFIRTAIAVVKADGKWSDPEIDALGATAEALGLSIADFCRIEQEASRMGLS